MYQLSILVVLYNSSVFDSNTLNSLDKLMLHNNKVRLVIWNNGPASIMRSTDFSEYLSKFDVSVTETLENESLAKIYNSFVDLCNSKHYLILDHDSVINQSYIDAVLKSTLKQISVPIIKCSKIIRAPFINKKVYSPGMEINNSDFIMSIGSGLVLNYEVIKRMKGQFGKVFDERFYLYGVDTTFFKRLNNLVDKKLFDIKILPPIVHSLSRYEVEKNTISNFRVIERSYDFGLSLRYYTPFYMLPLIIMKYLMKSLYEKFFQKKTVYNSKIIIKAFITGKHYRSKI